MSKYVIIGNGVAAAGCIEGIRSVDKDGEVTVLDATIIQRWLVGLEQNRGIGADV